MTVRVFLVDDHEVVRRGLRELVEAAGLEVVGEAGTVAETVATIGDADPDVAVLDVRLPDGDGISLCRQLRAEHARLRCLMLTSYADDEALAGAVLAGAAGYVLKQVRGTELIDDIRRVAAGHDLVDRATVERVRNRLRAEAEERERLSLLTRQERRVLELLAEGLSNQQIADRLYLAERTVKNYVSNVLAKLGMHRRTEAAVYAARLHDRTTE